jgi:hypothetical protein
VVVITSAATGYVASVTASSLVSRTDAGTGLVGVAAEFADSFTYTASTDTTIAVYDDLINTVFIAQADTSGINGATDVGQLFDLTIGTGSTLDMLSEMEIDADASTYDVVRVLGKVNHPNNNWGANVDVFCQFNVAPMQVILTSAAA